MEHAGVGHLWFSASFSAGLIELSSSSISKPVESLPSKIASMHSSQLFKCSFSLQ